MSQFPTDSQGRITRWNPETQRMEPINLQIQGPDGQMYTPGNQQPPSNNMGPSFGAQNPGEQGFRDYFKQRGVSDHEAPYWASKWDELQKRGQELGDPNYANRFLSNAEVFTGSAAQTAQNMWGNQSGNAQQGQNPMGPSGPRPQDMTYNPHKPQTGGSAMNANLGLGGAHLMDQQHSGMQNGLQSSGQTDGTLLGTKMVPGAIGTPTNSMSPGGIKSQTTGVSGSLFTFGNPGGSIGNQTETPGQFGTGQNRVMGAPSGYSSKPTKPLPNNNMGGGI